MKLNLLLANPGGVRSGYLNVGSPEGNDVLGCDLTDLSPLVDANEATEIVAHDVLDSFETTRVDRVLDHWLSRLAHGGTLALSVVDLREVARAFLGGHLSGDEANRLLHGPQSGPHDHRRCSLTLAQLAGVLEAKGMVVIKKRVENMRAVVVCRRP